MNELQNIDFLRDHELLVLLGVVKLLGKGGQSSTIIKYAFEEYKRMCRQYAVTPHNKSSFRRHLGELIQMNFISSKPMKRGRFLEITVSGSNLYELIEDTIEKRLVK